MRQSDEANGKQGKVSNHGSQFPTKENVRREATVGKEGRMATVKGCLLPVKGAH